MLLVFVSHVYILVSLNQINREFDRIRHDASVMENRMRLIAEQVGVSASDWKNPRYRMFR